MIGRSVILLCIAAMFIAIECKPVLREHKSLHRNVPRSVVQLKLTKADINRGVFIHIGSKPIVRRNAELVHRVPTLKSKRLRLNTRTAAMENEKDSNLAANDFPVVMRSKRNVHNKPVDQQIENLQKFNDDVDNTETTDYSSEMANEKTNGRQSSTRHASSQFMQKQDQAKQSKFINSEDYRDYAFDTTDNEHFNEDDDLLQQYYGTRPVRRAVSAIDDYGSFTDLMRASASENDRDDRFMRRLHYGYDDSFLNDEVDDENTEDDDAIYDEYDNYDGDDY